VMYELLCVVCWHCVTLRLHGSVRHHVRRRLRLCESPWHALLRQRVERPGLDGPHGQLLWHCWLLAPTALYVRCVYVCCARQWATSPLLRGVEGQWDRRASEEELSQLGGVHVRALHLLVVRSCGCAPISRAVLLPAAPCSVAGQIGAVPERGGSAHLCGHFDQPHTRKAHSTLTHTHSLTTIHTGQHIRYRRPGGREEREKKNTEGTQAS
jgi:hypothetical protein